MDTNSFQSLENGNVSQWEVKQTILIFNWNKMSQDHKNAQLHKLNQDVSIQSGSRLPTWAPGCSNVAEGWAGEDHDDTGVTDRTSPLAVGE
jgi:hypothetical protein